MPQHALMHIIVNLADHLSKNYNLANHSLHENVRASKSLAIKFWSIKKIRLKIPHGILKIIKRF